MFVLFFFNLCIPKKFVDTLVLTFLDLIKTLSSSTWCKHSYEISFVSVGFVNLEIFRAEHIFRVGWVHLEKLLYLCSQEKTFVVLFTQPLFKYLEGENKKNQQKIWYVHAFFLQFMYTKKVCGHPSFDIFGLDQNSKLIYMM